MCLFSLEETKLRETSLLSKTPQQEVCLPKPGHGCSVVEADCSCCACREGTTGNGLKPRWEIHIR